MQLIFQPGQLTLNKYGGAAFLFATNCSLGSVTSDSACIDPITLQYVFKGQGASVVWQRASLSFGKYPVRRAAVGCPKLLLCIDLCGPSRSCVSSQTTNIIFPDPSLVILFNTRFKVFKAMKVQVEVFWVVTPCVVAVGYQRLGGPCCLHS
jgi:hypothetical protein